MVLIADWGEFHRRALALARAAPPARARLVLRARPRHKRLALKLATDSTTITFRTRMPIILNRLATLQRELMAEMSGVPLEDAPAAPAAPAAAASTPGAAPASAPTASKRKPKKKRK